MDEPGVHEDLFALPHSTVDLTGRVALVTGTTSGLGNRFAKVLAAAGAMVAVAARRVERLEELVAEIERSGGNATAVPLDVTDARQIVAAVDAAEDRLGPVSILVNNAGISDAMYATRMPLELIDAVIATNLRGPFLLSTEIARRLIACGAPGRMVNISSMGAYHYAGGGSSLYSTTKAAIIRMTEVLAVEWARYDINVNCIAPGSFSSEMMDGMIARIGDFAETLPRRRLGQAPQLDSTLLFLVAPASECVTGAVVKVDDGQLPR